ncbi:MAG: hypothetical protein AB1831_04835 [Pseudomonadota bacterium]
MHAYFDQLRDLALALHGGRASRRLAVEVPEMLQAGPLRFLLDGDVLTGMSFHAEAMDAGEAALLEAYCETVEGLPLEEAAAYGADYTAWRLLGGAGADVRGILPPAGALPAWAAAQAALRGLGHARRAAPGMAPLHQARFLDLPAAWLELPAAARLQGLAQAIAAALAEWGLPPGCLELLALEPDIAGRPVRVVLGGGAGVADLPALLRRLEARLRAEVAPWLEVLMDERDDRNRLRRQILDSAKVVKLQAAEPTK